MGEGGGGGGGWGWGTDHREVTAIRFLTMLFAYIYIDLVTMQSVDRMAYVLS